MIEVYIRNDLNMRKGKISAQVSHAVMALWLSAMERIDNKLILHGANYDLFNDWDKTVRVIPVADEFSITEIEKNNHSKTALIADHGRTEFGGVITKTCVGLINSNFYKKKTSFKSDRSIPDRSQESKQCVVVNKSVKLSKWELAEKVAIGSLYALFDGAYNEEDRCIVLDLNDSELSYWLNYAFAKVVLQVKTDEDINAIEISDNYRSSKCLSGIQSLCTVIGPNSVSKINKVTGGFKLL